MSPLMPPTTFGGPAKCDSGTPFHALRSPHPPIHATLSPFHNTTKHIHCTIPPRNFVSCGTSWNSVYRYSYPALAIVSRLSLRAETHHRRRIATQRTSNIPQLHRDFAKTSSPQVPPLTTFGPKHKLAIIEESTNYAVDTSPRVPPYSTRYRGTDTSTSN